MIFVTVIIWHCQLALQFVFLEWVWCAPLFRFYFSAYPTTSGFRLLHFGSLNPIYTSDAIFMQAWSGTWQRLMVAAGNFRLFHSQIWPLPYGYITFLLLAPCMCDFLLGSLSTYPCCDKVPLSVYKTFIPNQAVFETLKIWKLNKWISPQEIYMCHVFLRQCNFSYKYSMHNQELLLI